MIQANHKGVVVATIIKVNKIHYPMMHKDQTIVEEDNIEARGVREVMVASQETI